MFRDSQATGKPARITLRNLRAESARGRGGGEDLSARFCVPFVAARRRNLYCVKQAESKRREADFWF